MKPTLVVLAAGMGSRYGGVKQMDGFGPNEQWLLEYSVYDAIKAGFGKVVFILREAIVDDFENYFEPRLPSNIKREYVLQELSNIPEDFNLPSQREKPWGTGHAVLVTKEVVKEPFAVINADDFYGRDAFKQLADFLGTVNNDKFEFGMVGYRLKNTLSEHGSVSRGICNVNDDGLLNEVEEHTKIQKQPNGVITNVGTGSQKELHAEAIVSMNCWAFTSSLFSKLNEQFSNFLQQRGNEEKSEFYIPYAVQELKDEGLANITVMTSDDIWFGVTYADDKNTVEQQLALMHEQGIYPDDLWT